MMPGRSIVSIRNRTWPIMTDIWPINESHQTIFQPVSKRISCRIDCQCRRHISGTQSISDGPFLNEMWNRGETFVLSFATQKSDCGIISAMESKNRYIFSGCRAWNAYCEGGTGERIDVVCSGDWSISWDSLWQYRVACKNVAESSPIGFPCRCNATRVDAVEALNFVKNVSGELDIISCADSRDTFPGILWAVSIYRFNSERFEKVSRWSLEDIQPWSKCWIRDWYERMSGVGMYELYIGGIKTR